jgi:hypothetical protein
MENATAGDPIVRELRAICKRAQLRTQLITTTWSFAALHTEISGTVDASSILLSPFFMGLLVEPLKRINMERLVLSLG